MNTDITLAKIKKADTDGIRSLLQDWVADSVTGESDTYRIDRILTLMRAAPRDGGERTYLVAKDKDNKIIGMIGYKRPCSYMRSFCKTHHVAEIINFYMVDHFKDHTTATEVLDQVETSIKQGGGAEIVINRAPRYAVEIERYFRTRSDYRHVGVAKGFFGENLDTPVWVRKLA